MDLTQAPLALASLSRRGVSDALVDAASRVAERVGESGAGDANEAVGECVEEMTALLRGEMWECRAAGLLAAADFMKNGCSREDLREIVGDAVEANLEDREPRVRTCVVKAMEELARMDGQGTWERFGPVLCGIINDSFDLDKEERAKTQEQLAAQEVRREARDTHLTSLVHETVGWKALETSMRALEALIRGYGGGFVTDGHLDWNNQYITSLVAERSLLHENRFVREVGYDLCAAIAAATCESNQGCRDEHTDAIAAAVRRGLEDNWSQVRYAASAATRNLMTGLKHSERKPYLDLLVPRMCLNRYYLAQGVRIYSQETWVKAFPGEQGIQVVSDSIGAVVDFYCAQSKADNHGVREAACQSIAELSNKIDAKVLSNHVDQLLSVLLECFRDDSWTVRDCACVATGLFVTNFAAESEPQLEDLFQLWFDHLSDNIQSVRDDSAVALGNAMRAYPEIATERVCKELPALLEKFLTPDPPGQSGGTDKTDVVSSPASSPRSIAGASSIPRKIIVGSLADLHTARDKNHSNEDQQLFSCGSLAPKLKRRGVGCMDHGHLRAKLNWEYTDGALFLLRELCLQDASKGEQFLPNMERIAHCDQPDLKVTLWRQVVPIAKAVGKRPFKRYIELILPDMIMSLEHESQLVATAAADCLMFLMEYLGRGIMQGRIQGLENGDRLWCVVDGSPLVSTFTL